jgi:nucleoside-diphosphate-sugar epimerase
VSLLDIAERHAVTDRLVLSKGKKYGVKTAIMVPPVMFGNGEGPLKNTGMTLLWLADAVRKRGKWFFIGEGKHVVSTVHVRDLSNAFLLVEEVLKEGGKASWGSKGWHYVESREYVFVDIVTAVVKEMERKGVMNSGEIDEIEVEGARGLHPWAELLWGVTMRVSADRIRGLGWRAEKVDVLKSIPELVG